MKKLGVSVLDVLILSLVAALAYSVKRFYSTASAEDLRWALGPTAALVERFTAMPFTAEHGAGYVSASRYVVIAPACAGINYLIVVFVSLTVTFVVSLRTPIHKATFLVFSACLAYAAMVVVNAVRISIGLALAARAPFGPGYAECVHRVEGTAVYVLALWALCSAVASALRRVTV